MGNLASDDRPSAEIANDPNATPGTVGSVALVGAGPGNPGLLTLRGAKLLSHCDVVLYDGLSNTEMLAHAPQAVCLCVGKHGQSRIWKQEEIIAEMLRHAALGKRVVRLKGGDPAVFARTSEEVNALREAGVAFEIVPGITAALAAGSFAGIPITHRGIASAVALVTGHEQPGKPESDLDWSALAKFPGTLVIYMGVTTAGSWTQALLDAGKPADTPCAILRRCSLPDQQQIHCRLDEIAAHLSPASKFRPPAITIIGPVTQLAETMDWFGRRPLLGKRILVTRPADQADELAEMFEELGAVVFKQPAIEITPPNDWTLVDAAIERLPEYQTIVFCSRNGVHRFLNRLLHLGHDMRRLAGLRIAVAGSATEQTLGEFHLRADVVPDSFTAEALVEELTPHVSGESILLLRASRGRDVIGAGLRDAGATVDEVAVYEHQDVSTPDPDILRAMQEKPMDWITITSSATARSLHQLIGSLLDSSQLPAFNRIATISPITSEAVRELGWTVDAEADPHTMNGLVDAITRAETSSK